MQRELHLTEEFKDFYNFSSHRTQNKIDYILRQISTEKIINSKFVKHITGTYLYEIRISTNNEYRVFLFAIDNDNFINSHNVLLLSGFLKKANKDYKKQIKKAIKITEKWKDQNMTR